MILSMYVRLGVIFMSLKGFRLSVEPLIGSLNNPADIGSLFHDDALEPALTSASDDVMYDILSEYCPLSHCGYDFSDYNVTIPSKVCCRACQCNDTCAELGNCCYDKDVSRMLLWKPEFCTQTTIVNTSDYSKYSRRSYMLYQHCSNSDNTSLLDACYSPDEDSLTDMLPVYSNTTGRQYRNKYCAMCNMDDDKLIEWSHTVHCDSVLHFSSLLFKDTDIMDVNIIRKLRSGLAKCVLYLSPPPQTTQPIQCLHPQDMISSCDPSNPLYADLQEKCQAYYSPVDYPPMIFKNVFCMMCHEGRHRFRKIDCPGYRQLIDPDYPSFTSILTLHEHHVTSLSTRISYRCTAPAVYNEEIDKCMNMRCPLTTYNVGGTCFPAFASVSHVRLDFRITVSYPASQMFSTRAILGEVEVLFWYLYYKANIESASILNLRVDGALVQAEVQRVLYLTDLSDVKELFTQLASNIIHYNTNQDNIFTMEMGNTALFQPVEESLFCMPFEDSMSTMGSTCNLIAMSNLLFCPLVSFPVYKELEGGAVEVEGMLFQAHEYLILYSLGSFKGISLCSDTFISRYKNTYHGHLNGSGTDVAVWLYTLALSLLLVLTSIDDQLTN